MYKKEMREVLVTYCDECGKVIDDYSSMSKHYPNGDIKNFHSMYTGEKTCIEKYEENEIQTKKKLKVSNEA